MRKTVEVQLVQYDYVGVMSKFYALTAACNHHFGFKLLTFRGSTLWSSSILLTVEHYV
jgi:hypothetical protein